MSPTPLFLTSGPEASGIVWWHHAIILSSGASQTGRKPLLHGPAAHAGSPRAAHWGPPNQAVDAAQLPVLLPTGHSRGCGTAEGPGDSGCHSPPPSSTGQGPALKSRVPPKLPGATCASFPDLVRGLGWKRPITALSWKAAEGGGGGEPCVAGQALGGHWFRGRGSAALGQAPVSPGSGALVESWFSPGLVLGPSWFRSPRLVLCPSWYRGPGPSWFRPGSGAPVQEGLKVKAGRASGGFPTSRQPQAGSVPMAPQRLCGPLSCPVLGGDLWRGRGNSARPPPRRVTHKNPVLRAAGGGPRGGDSGPGLLGPGV